MSGAATPEEPAGTAPAPVTAVETADLTDKYDRMTRLADLFDRSGEDLRRRSALGAEVLGDPAVADSAEIARTTWEETERDVLAATSGEHGLLARSADLEADAVVVRATVATYRWIDELQAAAYETLGSIAGRAIGYLAPEVALGGAVVSAGLIETDALDRDGVATYLAELAEHNPELLEHVTSGGGGLLDGLRMRSLLTTGSLAGEAGGTAARGGLRAVGAGDFRVDVGAALRDVAGELVEADPEPTSGDADGSAPRGLEDLLRTLASSTAAVAVQQVGADRFIAYLRGPGGGPGRLRLVSGDPTAYAAQVVRAIRSAVDGVPDARVMLVGAAHGGVTAAEVAAASGADLRIEQVVTAGAPAAQSTRVPEPTRVLALEDRSDPVALLGSLVNLDSPNRVSVVFEPPPTARGTESAYVVGARAADAADHPALRAELGRLAALGFLAPA